MKTPNSLINTKSPYLLQHAHNPVEWREWSDEVFEKARKESKLVLVSIGYSACHWCHVMEHECFEDEETAALMNKHFLNIKVDREERPDIDHAYMTAVQVMSGHGGWPLNCFVLPDGRPIYGGTYFPKEKWKALLLNLASLYHDNREKVETYAGELADGIKHVNELAHLEETEAQPFLKENLEAAVEKWQKRFDKVWGGNAGAPKFPMPNNYLFLLRFGCLSGNKELLEHVHLTLQKMADGGIYDHLGGGFARYSTDSFWKAPHFEKMLYDNAQLIQLYSEAYRQNGNPLYKKVVYETIGFVERELRSPDGGFYSALDADSEGKEGLFYTWEKEELLEILNKDYEVFADFYSVNEKGLWEDERYILLRDLPAKEIAEKHKISIEELEEVINRGKKNLLHARATRVRPGLDDKIITSWNGLMCRGLVEAYNAFNEPRFLSLAQKNIDFIAAHMLYKNGNLYRCCKGVEAYGTGFLDDYAFVIDGYIALFTATGDKSYLQRAETLMEHCLQNFYDAKGLFYYIPKESGNALTRHFEVNDNVIPSSNSQMALNLHNLYALTGKPLFEEITLKMLGLVQIETYSSPAYHSNWALAILAKTYPFFEACIVGKDVDDLRAAFAKHYPLNTIFVYSKHASEIALLQGRYKPGETLIYVCRQKSCMAPVKTVEEALEQINCVR